MCSCNCKAENVLVLLITLSGKFLSTRTRQRVIMLYCSWSVHHTSSSWHADQSLKYMTFTDNAIFSGKHLQRRELAKISPKSLERVMSNDAY